MAGDPASMDVHAEVCMGHRKSYPWDPLRMALGRHTVGKESKLLLQAQEPQIHQSWMYLTPCLTVLMWQVVEGPFPPPVLSVRVPPSGVSRWDK